MGKTYRMVSVRGANGPIATAYALALRWARFAESLRYTRKDNPPRREKLWRRVNLLSNYVGEYIPHPMDKWEGVGSRNWPRGAGNKARRRMGE